MPLLLNQMPLERANQVLRHPLHQAMVGTLTELITSLRQCRGSEDYFHFQQDLLERVLAVQDLRARCHRVAKLLRQGKGIPADAPELRSAEPVTDPQTWETEADVCERIDRQLRSIADALAWRAFSYHRGVIIALSRNQHPGPMVGKAGLAAERAFVIDWWQRERRFVLLHDLTACLSIEAIRSGGPLPGSQAGHLVQLDLQYRTHLALLGTAFDFASQRGIQGMKVPGGRALVATDIIRGYRLWSEQRANSHRHAGGLAPIHNTG